MNNLDGENSLEELQACAITETAAALCYADVASPGYTRLRTDAGFVFLDAANAIITDPVLLQRFARLTIPPAWTDVWICAKAEGHIQATGRDARGRKQYIYHSTWEEARSVTKFERLVAFADALPSVRQRVGSQLNADPFAHDTMLAFAVRLLDETLVRVGNREYMRDNQSFGLTTLRHFHVNVSGAVIQLKFRGKGGKEWESNIADRRLARLARQYQELPGQELLQYQDEKGRSRAVDSSDVNAYLRQISGSEFTAKDFRTWGGTVNAAVELNRLGPAGSEKEARKKIVQAVRRTAAKLGNTPATCRKYYIHPRVVDAFADRTLFRAMMSVREQAGGDGQRLRPEERGVVALLKEEAAG